MEIDSSIISISSYLFLQNSNGMMLRLTSTGRITLGIALRLLLVDGRKVNTPPYPYPRWNKYFGAGSNMYMLLFIHSFSYLIKKLMLLAVFFSSTLFTCINYFNLRCTVLDVYVFF
jgi:hypothetical protein